MGDATALVTLHLLEDGANTSFPSVHALDYYTRFEVLPLAGSSADYYAIWDFDLQAVTTVHRAMLKDPTFDLVGWYRDHLDWTGLYVHVQTKHTLWLQDQINELQRAAEPIPEEDETSGPKIELSCMIFGTETTSSSTSTSLSQFSLVQPPGGSETEYSNASDDSGSIPGLQTISGMSGSGSTFDTLSKDFWVSDIEEDRENSPTNEFPGQQLEQEPKNKPPVRSMVPMSIDIEHIESLDDLSGYQLGRPFPGDETLETTPTCSRFHIKRVDFDFYEIYDEALGFESWIHSAQLKHETFSIGRWYAEQTTRTTGYSSPAQVAMDWMANRPLHETIMGAVFLQRISELLELGSLYDHKLDSIERLGKQFTVEWTIRDASHFKIHDHYHQATSYLPRDLLDDPEFNLLHWYEFRIAQFELDGFDFLPAKPPRKRVEQFKEALAETAANEECWPDVLEYIDELIRRMADDFNSLNVNAVQVDRGKFPAVQRNVSSVKEKGRVLPKPLVLKCLLGGHQVRALVDSGSQGDFISTTLVDQLQLRKEELPDPLKLQLAVQGSRSVIKYRVSARFQYESIDTSHTFDVINLNNYDMILGTPWLYQHRVSIGFNPGHCSIGSSEPMPIRAGPEDKPLVRTLQPVDDVVEKVCEELRARAEPLCRGVEDTELPPLCAINHTIPLIDPNRKYPWCPSRCLEAFRAQWAKKRHAYLCSGQWEITSAGNTILMMLIPKPSKDSGLPDVRTLLDLRECNKNTYKLTSPLTDMEGMLRRMASKLFRTTLDLKSAYKQIQIIPEHVERTSMTTPDGNMVSHVIQIGDCNAPVTYQALMNHLFSPYIGRFMDVYLDDIVIYDDDLDEHAEHVKLVLDILVEEKLYLSKDKLRFIALELKLLGRVIDDKGIRMDTDKVDSVLNWKVPTNRDLLRGFLRSVGYLADDVPSVRIPMGVLSALTGDTVPFCWTFTEQQAFEDVKQLVHGARGHSHVPLTYAPDAQPIRMVTDGSATGISGIVSQGADWKTAKVAAFYSAKLNLAQQNYAVHEIEMLAGIETMLCHRDILQGTKFKWLTDHKGLIHLLNQKNLSGRQARWLEKISSFDFEVIYIAGSENILADALSCMYLDDSGNVVRSWSEYTYHDMVDDDLDVERSSSPLVAGVETRGAARRHEEALNPCPETSAEFARQVRDHFVLHGPREQKEGRSRKQQPLIAENTDSDNEEMPDLEDLGNPDTAEEHVELPSFMSLLNSGSEGIDLIEELRNNYANDPFFTKILEKPKEFHNFEVENGIVYLKEHERKLLCIPKLLIKGRSAQEIVISEAHSLLAHLGAAKTLDYLRDHLWWKDMVSDTQAYCETCQTCKQSKPSNQKPYGLLNPLPIPGNPWESIGMDFVGPLPESKNRNGSFDLITVVICLLTGMVHLVLSRTNYNARQLAELMFKEVYKHHGLPKNIISDRDVLFTSTLWGHLHKLVGMNLKMSSAYHPQTDGSTEQAN
ncbi:unnamed protein product [Cyclocybe aegerita]|uniref:RNA-directed DNA polymerase n=1 Tax=Cyclocybe aegerita TaxID=1973307 RepID=A0A8S0XIZ6_CYCAE|nr:unnamed protein product [Cyclocybe aegerita]